MKVAVRSLCEFAAREGSLEHRYTPSPNADEGIQGHKTLQARGPAHYQSEYLSKASVRVSSCAVVPMAIGPMCQYPLWRRSKPTVAIWPVSDPDNASCTGPS